MGVRYFWRLNLRAAFLLLQGLSFFLYEWCEELSQDTNLALSLMSGDSDAGRRTGDEDVQSKFLLGVFAQSEQDGFWKWLI